MTKILVIDDEPDLIRFVRRALEAEGYQVLGSADGLGGLRLALEHQPALIVLDLLMPRMHGEAVLSALLAQDPAFRILVLSATADIQLRISCLEQGAVDFLAKPFAIRELVARVRGRLGEDASNRRKNRLRVGDMVLDLEARQLLVDGRPTVLPKREFLLLRHLMRNPDVVCSRQELLSEVWGYDFDPSTNVVDVCVGRLRGKLVDLPVETIRGVGYCFYGA